MKKLLLTLALTIAVVTSILAGPVTAEKAQLVAKNFWTLNTLGKWTGMVDRTESLGLTEMYLFAKPEGGYVIVAANDCALPILGYSTDALIGDSLPANMMNWLKGYAWEVSKMREHNVHGSERVTAEWNAYVSGSLPNDRLVTVVTPLLTTTWGQGQYYNNACPMDAAAQQRVPTGCVATSMAQVMKYWNHPQQGRGSRSYTHPTYGALSADFGNTTYDWTNMPVTLNAYSTAQQVQAVATLMYQVGISICTNYSPSSSGGSAADLIARTGINYPCVENALRQYFDYSPEVFGVRLSGNTDDYWRNMLRQEMDSARPVVYSGYDFSGGHCFVCDGYDSQDRFHFNWGWGGMSDGYFAVGSLNPGLGGIGTNASSSFNLDNVAVMGIRPAVRQQANTAVVTVTTDDNAHATVSGAGSYNNFSDLVTLTVTTQDGYRFDCWNDGDRTQPRRFWANGNVSLTAHVVPVVGDTIAYCGNAFEATTTNRYFGLKVEAQHLPANRSLRCVQVFGANAGDYAIRLYNGDNYSPSLTPYYQETFHLEGNNTWESLRFAQTVPVDNTKPLWIIAYCNNNNYPAPLTSYCGNQNGSWSSPNGVVWNEMLDMTFMIRAIFSSPTDVIITGQAADTTQGSVQGGGRYAQGEQCTLLAVASGDNVFDHWNDGSTENPRTVTASTSTTYTAYFSNCVVNAYPLLQDFSDGLGCWTAYSASQSNEADMGIYSSSSWWGTVAYFKFCSMSTDNTYDQYLISPRLAAPNVVDMSLRYSCYSSIPETFSVVYSTTDNNPSSFTHVLRTQSVTLSTWDSLHVTIPAEAKYVALHYTTQHGYYLYIDDIEMNGLPLPQHTISAVAENAQMGTVTGGGSFEEGTTITLLAQPYDCFTFVRWQDGNTQNPRTVVVQEDMTYTASFASVTAYGQETVVACDSAQWQGNWYYESSSAASYTTTTASGCDSVITLLLTINHSVATDTTIQATNAYEVDGVVYDHDATVVQTLSTADGCDSIVTINITIVDAVNDYLHDVRVWTSNQQLMVTGAEGLPVEVYDVLGRRIVATPKAPQQWVAHLPKGGLYMVVVNKSAARKVVAQSR